MLALRIALRYLFAKKSHAAVNIISMISMAGIAVAAMAMVCVLSVFNGFTDLASSRLSAIDPEIKVTLPYGAVIADGDSLSCIVASVPGVAAVRQVLEQRALAVSDGDQMPVKVRGIEEGYSDVSTLSELVIDGEMVDSPSMNCALLSVRGGYPHRSSSSLRVDLFPHSPAQARTHQPSVPDGCVPYRHIGCERRISDQSG